MSKGKRCTGQSLEETRHKLLCAHSLWSPTGQTLHAYESSYDNTREKLSIGAILLSLVVLGFYQGWVKEALFVWHLPNSRVPKGNQMFSINHTVATNSWGTMSCTHQFWEWWRPSQNLSSQKPAKSQSCQQACKINSFVQRITKESKHEF